MRRLLKYIICVLGAATACRETAPLYWDEAGALHFPDAAWAPAAVVVGADGAVFVADVSGNSAVQVFSPHGVYQGGIGGYGRQPGSLVSPLDVSLTETGEVVVLDFGTRRISVFGADGRFRRCFGDDTLQAPVACAASGGKIYVVDAATATIAVFDYAGRLAGVRDLGEKSPAPFDVAPRRGGGVTALTATAAIFLSPAGEIENTIPLERDGFRPVSFTLGPAGQLVVLGEKEKEGVIEYSFRYFTAMGTVAAEVPVSLTQPAAIAWGPGDVLYVADPTRHTVKKYSKLSGK